MTTRNALRALTAAALVAATLFLAGCNGAGTTLPAGQAYLTIYNPNSTTDGHFYYTNIFVDNNAISIAMINEGGSYNVAVTAPAQHQIKLDFVQEPTSSSNQMTPVGPVLLNVPSQGCTYNGPTPTSANGSGC